MRMVDSILVPDRSISYLSVKVEENFEEECLYMTTFELSSEFVKIFISQILMNRS